MVAMFGAAAAQSIAISPSDLRSIEGKWSGTLTYLDYSSNKPVAIASELTISRVQGMDAWLFEHIYPKEPKANSRAEIKLSGDGRYFDGEEVIGRTLNASGLLVITTMKKGMDNGRSATFRRTFTVSADSLSIKKEVKIDGTDTYFERNTYTWTRQR